MEKLTITEKQRLMGIGLMTMDKEHYTKFREYEKVLKGWFGQENEDLLGDIMYGTESFDFLEFLEKAGIEIEEDEQDI